MSTVSRRPSSKSPPPAESDPFRYGWRYIPVTQPDGTVVLDQVPLTLEDVLHPEVGDVIVQSDPHDSDLAYLKGVFKVQIRDDPEAVVLSDCQVDFNIPDVKPLCPDVALFFGVRRRSEWTSFDVAQERARAALVVEETSPDTRVNDVEKKVDYYHRARVPWYVIADVSYDDDGRRRIELILYRWRPERYQRIAADEHGRVWLEPVGLWLGLSRDPQDGFIRLACFDPATGQEVGDYAAVRRALDESQELRVDAERRARQEADAAPARRRTPAPTPSAAPVPMQRLSPRPWPASASSKHGRTEPIRWVRETGFSDGCDGSVTTGRPIRASQARLFTAPGTPSRRRRLPGQIFRPRRSSR